MNLLEIKLLLVTLCVLKSFAQEPLVLQIPQGRLRGTTFPDRYGAPIYGFHNIPYAKPPIGELRFRAPEYPDAWDGIRDATSDLPFCIQQLSTSEVIGQEDCLYLNVYLPELPQNATRLRTVMVFVHGGSFTTGTGSRAEYGPQLLLPEDVIVVSINYRLGILAGFSIDDIRLRTPGNAGMKDIVLSLEWVRNNIVYFGGNPNDVTIFGSSAGAAAVHLLAVSPLAKGLFHRVICQSGSAIASWTLGIENSGLRLAEFLNIQTQDLQQTLNTLQSLPAELLVGSQQGLTESLQLYLEGIANPIVEKPSNEPAFLTEDPFDLIATGNYNNISLLTGYTDAEGIFFGVFHILEDFFISLDFHQHIPGDLNIEPGSPTAFEVANLIREFYFGDTIPTVLNLHKTFQLYTDLFFSFPAYRSGVEHVKTTNLPIYLYRFSAVTSRNTCKIIVGMMNIFPGATHCDELGYLFENDSVLPPLVPNTVEAQAVNRVVKYWTNFAKYGTPTPNSTEWKPIATNEVNYFDIGTNVSVPGVNPDAENIAFWTNLYTTYFRPRG